MENVEKDLDKLLVTLSKSKFRSRFHLKDIDKKYVEDKGLEKIESHAVDFITSRLASKIIPNDGKQTPMRGHPVFIAQHATATCCRGCIYKWHKIPMNKELNTEEKEYIKNVIMKWIEKEMNG
ncbi:MAG: DUF4186 domain-containing protein [Clostridia bacterium]|nr:DUF4186 domain-containing protein [Clostridia bacterium]